MGLTATPLEGSYHLGQMIYNDCGPPHGRREPPERPSGRAESERFSVSMCVANINMRNALSYEIALFTYLSTVVDLIESEPIPVEDTIPHGPILTRNDFRALEACSKCSLGQGQKGLRRHAVGRRSMMVRRRLRNYALRKYVGNVIVLVYHSCFHHPVSCSSLPYCDSHGC